MVAVWSEVSVFDVEHDELPAERYDLVLALLALHHMGDVAAVIDRCGRLLAPAGHLALIDLDHDADGAFHAFDQIAPKAPTTQRFNESLRSFLRRELASV